MHRALVAASLAAISSIAHRPSPAAFAIDVLVCPRCAGPRRILGAVTEPHAVQRLLNVLGLAA